MANWNTLKTAVADIINTNGNQAITGQILQNVLNNIITNVGENSTFVGVATPTTNPGTPDGNVFYLATTAGTYSNFNGIVIEDGEAVILEWRGSWSKKDTGFATRQNLLEIERNIETLNTEKADKEELEQVLLGKNLLQLRYENGYVTSPGNTYVIISTPDNDNYKYCLVNVKPGEKYIYWLKNELSAGYKNQLIAFTDSTLKNRYGTNITVQVGFTEITVPEGATILAITTQFGEGDTDEDVALFYKDTALQVALQKAIAAYNNVATVQNIEKQKRNIPIFEKGFYLTINDRTLEKRYYSFSMVSEVCRIPRNPTTLTSVWDGDVLGYGVIFLDKDYNYISGFNPSSNGTSVVISSENIPENAAYFIFQTQDYDYMDLFILNEEEYILTGIRYSDIKGQSMLHSAYNGINQAQSEIKGGYVTSAGIEWLFNQGDINLYKFFITSVTPGETIYFYTNSVSVLNAFGTSSNKKINGQNFTVYPGLNKIVVPEGVSQVAFTLQFGEGDDYKKKAFYREDSQFLEILELASQKAEEQPKKMRVKRDNGKLYVATNWDENNYLVQSMSYVRESTKDNSPNANFINIYTSPKNGNLTSGVMLKGAGDDICPANVNGSYIGGNHGWNYSYKVTSSSHGKTVSDIGSVYRDANGVLFYIVRILSQDEIQVISENKSTDGYTYEYERPYEILDYVSNGANTSSINIESVSSIGNLYNSSMPAEHTLLIDGKKITEDGTYDCDSCVLVESHDILDLPSIVDNLVSNRPENGYTQEPLLNSFSGTEKLFNHSISYDFNPNGVCVVSTTFRAYKRLYFGFHGFVQSMGLYGTSPKLYCPKSLPIVAGGKTWDLRQLSAWDEPANISLTSEYWENPSSPPDRAINLNGTVNVMVGYITDRGTLKNRKDMIASAMNFATTRKLYPMGISNSRVLEAGAFYSAVAYRSFTNPANNPAGRTNFTYVDLGSEIYVYADYHGSLNDKLPIQENWNGKRIEVLEKSDKCNIYTDVITGYINIESTATKDSYGYIVLKLS